MIDGILSFSIRQRWLVMIGVLVMAAFGAWNFTRLPIDAVPDITNVQVQINTRAPGYSPLEVEQRITFPIETSMGGLPNLQNTRSLSRYGLSQVTVVFKDGTDIYFARQLVNERVQQVKDRLPPGIETAMGPVSTGLGEIYLYTVEAKPKALKADGKPYSPTDLRTIQDWIIKPQLRNVSGVIEVNTIGGFEKQFHVLPDPAQLMAYKLSFREVMTALAANNANVGAGYIERNGEQYLVRTPGQVANIEEIKEVVIGSRNGVPIRISDVADVREGQDLRTGGATLNGEEIVLGTAMLLIGENSRTVAQRVAAKIGEIGRSSAGRRNRAGDLRPYASGRSNHRDRRKEPRRRRAAGHRHPVPDPGELQGRHRDGLRHSVVDALHHHRNVRKQGQRQPDEPGRDRFRHHHRRRGDHRRELSAGAGRRTATARPYSHREERFETILAGSREVIGPSLFGTLDHRRRLPADPDADGRGRQDVHADGADGAHRASGRQHPVDDLRSRRRSPCW